MTMTYDDTVARMAVVRPELESLASAEQLDETQVERFNSLTSEWDQLAERKDEVEQLDIARASALDKMKQFAANPNARVAPDSFERDPLGDPGDSAVSRNENPWDLDSLSRSNAEELFARAVSAAELTPGPGDNRREALTRMLETSDDSDGIARTVLATTSPEYKTAYGKIVRAGGIAGANLTDGEQAAVEAANVVSRAMSAGTAASGGYLVPTDIEAAVTLTADGTTNPIYNLARRVQTTGTTYRVVGSPNAAWSWDGENTEVSDDTPTFTNTDITLYQGQGFIPVSIAAGQAISNVTSIVAEVLAAGWNDLVGAALTTGSGTAQPFGVVTANTASAVASAATDTFAVGDVYATAEGLAARYRRNASWVSGISTLNSIRQFASSDGHALLARLSDGEPQNILGRPWYENPDMDDAITATAENYILCLGDFSHFVIAEAIGTMTEVIPHVFGTTGRPIGARGLFAVTRFGSDSVNDGAFSLLNVT